MDNVDNVNNDISIQHNITDHMPENRTVFTVSSIVSVISCLVTIFGLNQLPFAYRIIICLSAICLISLFNIVFLYIKEREHYYQICYNVALCEALTIKMNAIKAENEKLKADIHYV